MAPIEDKPDVDYSDCPQNIWIGRHGVSDTLFITLDEVKARNWLSESTPTKRLWNAVLEDPVEYFLIPPVPARLTDQRPE